MSKPIQILKNGMTDITKFRPWGKGVSPMAECIHVRTIKSFAKKALIDYARAIKNIEARKKK